MNLVGFYWKRSLFKLNKFDYYKKSFKELSELGVKITYFYQEDNAFVLEKDIIDGIKKIWVELIAFQNENEIISHLKKIEGKIFINTFEEQEIEFTNRIRKSIWQETTKNPQIFLNKYLQRSTIGEFFPETIVQFKKISIEESRLLSKDFFPPMPCIVKPIGWVQSSWVSKINNYSEYEKALETIEGSFQKLKEKRLKNESILLEEFIDGEMYTIDYYVDEKQNIKLSKPVLVKLWIDYGINDFCNISRFISHEVENNVNREKLHDFVKKTVVWWNFKNTFVHHEFKINSKWEFKTIETNWRIWWFRLDMYQIWYNINLLKFPFEEKEAKPILQKNIAMFALYPREKSIFYWYHEDIIKKIESLKSFHRINRGIKEIGAEIWLTQDWYGKVGSIELANSNYDEFKRDVELVENIYFDIIKTR